MWLVRASSLLFVVVSAPAHAFVCSRVQDGSAQETGPSLSWFSRDLTYGVHAAGTTHLPGDDEVAVISRAFDVWAAALSCGNLCSTDVTFSSLVTRPTHDLVGFNFLDPTDNENLLIFRDTDWPHPHLVRVIALTTTTYSPQSGEVFDADIEFNSQQFQFADLQACCPDCDLPPGIDPACQAFDLMNTTVHEIGHLLGLGHTTVAEASMAASAQEGEVHKRDLDADDHAGVLFKYPEAAPNGYCDEPNCATGAEQCGACNPLACPAGESCGPCPPPDPLTTVLAVRTLGSDNGFGGCGCSEGSVGLLSLLACGVALALRQRHWGRRSS